MGSKNIQISFKTIEFISYNFNQILNYLNFKLYTFTFLNTLQWNFDSINPNMFCMAKNVL